VDTGLRRKKKGDNMAIFRCNKCGFLREASKEYIGKSGTCPQCKTPITGYDTVIFIQKILQKYAELRDELKQLQAATAHEQTANTVEEDMPVDISNIDIHNSTIFTESHWQQPILSWFAARNVDAEVNNNALDTTGFFDEIAVELGDNYDVLKEVSRRIASSQRGNYTSTNLNLAKYSQKDLKTLQRFCRNLHQYSFISKYFYHKNDKRAHLKLQTATPIVQFFNGEWLEWYGFIKIITLCQAKGVDFSCLRSISVKFSNEDKHELDLFFLINGIPLCIECKSGEFRSMIEKYSTLRKRLKLEKNQFWLLGLDLSDEQAQGLTAMYDLQFVTLAGLEEALNSIYFKSHGKHTAIKKIS
jgi:hypothetical protein